MTKTKLRLLQQGDDPHEFSFRLPFEIGNTVYWIRRYHGEKQETHGDCPVCGGAGSILGVNGSEWGCPSNLCHGGVIVLWRTEFNVESGEVVGFDIALDGDLDEQHCVCNVLPEDNNQRCINLSELFTSEGDAFREAGRQERQTRKEQLAELGGEIPEGLLTVAQEPLKT